MGIVSCCYLVFFREFCHLVGVWRFAACSFLLLSTECIIVSYFDTERERHVVRNTLSTTQLKLYNKLITYFASSQSENENICQSIRFVTVDFLRFLRPFFFHVLPLFFFLSFVPSNLSVKSQMVAFKMKIYYIDAIVIPLSAAAVSLREAQWNGVKKILEKKICLNINLKSIHVIFALLWIHLSVTLFLYLRLIRAHILGFHFQPLSCSFLAQPLQKSQIN